MTEFAFLGALFFIVGLKSNHPFEFRRNSKGWRKVIGWCLITLGALNIIIESIKQISYSGDIDFKSSSFAMGFAISIAFIFWGIYTISSIKVMAPIWKRIVLSIIYPLMTFLLIGTAIPSYETAVNSLIVMVILTIVSLLVNWKSRNGNNYEDIKVTKVERTDKEEQIKFGSSNYYPSVDKSYNTQSQESKPNKNTTSLPKPNMFDRLDNYSERMVKKTAHNFRKKFLKIIATLLIPYFFILDMVWIGHPDLVIWSFFYVPYFIILICYCEKLLWQKKKLSGYDLLLIPLLKKIGLFKGKLNRKLTTCTILPALLFSVIFPLIILGIGYRNSTGLCHFLLVFPILCWIAALAINYSNQWVDEGEKNEYI